MDYQIVRFDRNYKDSIKSFIYSMRQRKQLTVSEDYSLSNEEFLEYYTDGDSVSQYLPFTVPCMLTFHPSKKKSDTYYEVSVASGKKWFPVGRIQVKDYQSSSFLSAEALYATFVGGTYKYIVEEETEDFEIVYRVRRDENYRYIIYITNDENGFAPEESQIIDLPPVRHSNDIDYVPKPKPDYGELMYKANYEPSTSLESNFTPIYTEKPKIETSSKASFTLPILLLLIISAILLMIITAF